MLALLQIFVGQTYPKVWGYNVRLKETRSVTLNVFRKKYFLFKSFVKIELSYVFTICSVQLKAAWNSE